MEQNIVIGTTAEKESKIIFISDVHEEFTMRS